jgi:hypothetical protein
MICPPATLARALSFFRKVPDEEHKVGRVKEGCVEASMPSRCSQTSELKGWQGERDVLLHECPL